MSTSLHCFILPSFLSPRPLYIFPYFSAPLTSPTPLVFPVSINNLYSYSSFPLTFFHHLFSYYLHFSPYLSPQLHFLRLWHSSISFSFYNFLSLTLSHIHLSTNVISLAFILHRISCRSYRLSQCSVVLHDFGLSEITYDDSDIG